jgi:hypothetical protein
MKDNNKWWESMECRPGIVDKEKKLEEMVRILELEVEKLKADLARSKEDHQYDNLVHKKEVESLKNPLHKLRNKGLV